MRFFLFVIHASFWWQRRPTRGQEKHHRRKLESDSTTSQKGDVAWGGVTLGGFVGLQFASLKWQAFLCQVLRAVLEASFIVISLPILCLIFSTLNTLWSINLGVSKRYFSWYHHGNWVVDLFWRVLPYQRQHWWWNVGLLGRNAMLPTGLTGIHPYAQWLLGRRWGALFPGAVVGASPFYPRGVCVYLHREKKKGECTMKATAGFVAGMHAFSLSI